jgi:hypothetical protein
MRVCTGLHLGRASAVSSILWPGFGAAGERTFPANRNGDQMSDIADRLKKIVVEHLGVEPEKVTDNANFIDDLGADSLDTVGTGHGVRGRVQRRDPG